MDWARAAAPMLAAFLASLVEFVEALTIVLAVGVVSGWRPALSGAACGWRCWLALVAGSPGPALAAVLIQPLQLAVGGLLLLFGARWLRKAVLRGAGRLALHDEARIFATETAALRQAVGRAITWTTAFKAVVIEGVEVIFIVIASALPVMCWCRRRSAPRLPGSSCWSWGWRCNWPLARVPEKVRSNSPWGRWSRASASTGSAKGWASAGPAAIWRFRP